MRTTFVGVGEAFDENLANTSILVESNETSILLDCGFTAASAFWQTATRPLALDAIYLSHFHGDHYFGIPALLTRSVQERRSRPLVILGQPGVAKQVRDLVDMAYPNVLSKAQFDISFKVCEPDTTVQIKDMTLTFAMNDHPMPTQSVRIESHDTSIFYSGDGRPTLETRVLAQGCDLIVHESFSLEPDTPGHGTVDSSIQFAQETGASALALVHVRREVRKNNELEILARIQQADGVNVFLPKPGEVYTL